MTTPNPEGTTSAYDLLSRPTLDLTDEEAQRIVEDLRKRRHAYVTSGTKDNPAKPPKEKPSKADATAAIAAAMNLDLGF